MQYKRAKIVINPQFLPLHYPNYQTGKTSWLPKLIRAAFGLSIFYKGVSENRKPFYKHGWDGAEQGILESGLCNQTTTVCPFTFLMILEKRPLVVPNSTNMYFCWHAHFTSLAPPMASLFPDHPYLFVENMLVSALSKPGPLRYLFTSCTYLVSCLNLV